MENKANCTKRMVRVRAAAEMLDISRSQAYNLINDGTLRAVKVGKSLRVPVEAVEALVTGEPTKLGAA